MGKLESAFKAEISRLARREARRLQARAIEEVRRLSRKVAQLTQEIGSLKQRLAHESSRTRYQQVSEAMMPEAAEHARLSPGLIKKLRSKLKITQPELARLLGVSISAVGFWESGKVRPRPEMKARIIGLRSMGRRDVQRLLAAGAAKTAQPQARKRGRPRKARRGGA